MRLGSTTREAVKAKTQVTEFSDVISVSKFEYDKPMRFRLLAAPHKVRQVFYPTVTTDEMGATRTGWNVLNLPLDSKTVFDFLAAADKSMKLENLPPGRSPDSVASNIAPQNRWLVPVLDRSTAQPEVRILSMGWSIVEQLIDLQEALDPDDNTMLQEGLLPMFDVVITAKRDTSKRGVEWHKRYYTVSPYRDNPFRGRVPVSALEKGIPDSIDPVVSGMFAKEEWRAVVESPVDIEQIAKPVSKEEIVLAFQNKPLNLLAVDSQGDPFFADADRLLAEVKKNEVKWIEFAEEGRPVRPLSAKTSVHEEDQPEVAEIVGVEPAVVDVPQDKKKTSVPSVVKSEVSKAAAGQALKSKPAW